MQIFVEGFPPVSLEDIRRINRLFTAYVFYETDRRGDRTCLCTRCGRRYTVEGLPKLMTPEWRAFMAARHNDPVTCPECGAAATLKSVGKSKGRKNLVEWANVVLFHTDGPTVWAEAGYVRKDYRDGLNPPVEVLGKMCYRFSQGTAEQWRLNRRYRAGELVEEWQRTKSVYEPFQPGAGYFAYLPGGFHAVGLERLNALKEEGEAALQAEREGRTAAEERLAQAEKALRLASTGEIAAFQVHFAQMQEQGAAMREIIRKLEGSGQTENAEKLKNALRAAAERLLEG